MARPLKPFVRSGGYYPSAKYTPLVYPGGYTTLNAKNGKPEPINTFLGKIVRFLAKRSLPMVKLEANFTPIQDLNGYDNPWPAGGGVNKFNQITEQARLDPDGSVVSAARLLTDYIPVVAGETYAVHIPYSGRGRGAFYDSDKNLLSYFGDFPVANTPAVFPRDGAILQTTDGYYFTFIAPSGASYVRYNIVINYGTTYNNDISFNYPSSVTTYAPYSNECPITGHTGCEVVRDGKNLFDKSRTSEMVANARVSVSNGNTYPSNGNTVSYYVSVVPNESYVLTTGRKAYIAFYDRNKSFVPTATTGWDDRTARTIPPNVHYLRFDFATANIDTVQLELGSTASDYEAFQGTTVPISFGQTVYGGKLTVFEDGSGQIVADRAITTLDGNTSWAMGTASTFRYFNASTTPLDTNAWELNIVSNLFKKQGSGMPYCQINGAKEVRLVFAPDDTNYDTVAKVQALLTQTPLQVVYPLATPITIPLTPGQIQTLVGENVVWVNDSDNIQVTAYGSPIT